MASLNTNEKQVLEKLFQMSGGYVLDFSDRTIAEFFRDNLKINFYDKKYEYGSGSKANTMRGFWLAADDKLVGKSIQELLSYIENKILLDEFETNEFPDKLLVKAREIAARLLGEKTTPPEKAQGLTETEFLKKEFEAIPLSQLELSGSVEPILKERITEIRKCLEVGAPLSVVFLCGSTLEGILLGVGTNNPKRFNQAKSAPVRDGKVLPFQQWNLASFIDVCFELELLEDDVKKHSHSLRDFRNYIHPFQQLSSGFNPHGHTAKIAWQVLQAAIFEIGKNLGKMEKLD